MMNQDPRPGIWGEDALPGEIIRVEPDGTMIFNVGAQFIPLTGANHKRRRAYRLE